MKFSDITPEMMEVISGWFEGGAAASCDRLEIIEDAILDEGEEVSSDERLALIREVRILKKELSVFIAKEGGPICS